MWFFPGFGIRPGRKVTWSKVLQVLRTRGSIIKMGASKYSNSMTGMPADSNLGKLTAPHIKTLITQNANDTMSNMFPLVYLNENLRYCNEN